jgi:hypothetical protein
MAVPVWSQFIPPSSLLWAIVLFIVMVFGWGWFQKWYIWHYRPTGDAWKNVDPWTLNNKRLMLDVVKSDGMVIKFVSERLRNDFEIAKAAVGNNCRAIRSIGSSLIDNKEIALLAVQQDGSLLNFLPRELRSDTEIVEAAIIDSPGSYRFANLSVRDEYTLLMRFLPHEDAALLVSFLHMENRRNVNLALKFLLGRDLTLLLAFDLFDNKIVMSKAVSISPTVLSLASEKLQNDFELRLLCDRMYLGLRPTLLAFQDVFIATMDRVY